LPNAGHLFQSRVMSSSPTSHAAVVYPDDAPVFCAFGDRSTFHLTGAQTEGRCVMFNSVTEPGKGPPPQRHANEDEWFLVLEGRAGFFKDGEWTEVPVGTSIFSQTGHLACVPQCRKLTAETNDPAIARRI
jgi:quercetin dioxygenase-like cupin family protein